MIKPGTVKRPGTEELAVLEFIRTEADDGWILLQKVVEHFRGQKTSARVVNLLDALFQKGWLLRGWPGWYVLNPKAPTE